MHQKKFDNLKPGDLVGFKHNTKAIGLVTRTRQKGRSIFKGNRYDAYTEVTINWRDEDGAFVGMYASDDNSSLEQLRIIVKAKNEPKYI